MRIMFLMIATLAEVRQARNLLGLRSDEFSMASPAIPHAKAVFRKWSLSSAQGLVVQALDLDSGRADRDLAVRHW